MANETPTVIIIGAGASGLSAASRLVENGITNIKILEAQNRIGGRIFSTEFGDSIVDLGATYCLEDSVVHNLVKDLDLVQHKTTPARLYHSKHGLLPEDFTKTLLQKIYELFIRDKTPGTSWKQHFVEQFQPCIVNHFKNKTEKALAEDSKDFTENILLLNTAQFSLTGGGHRRDEFPSNYKIEWKSQGYQTLLNVLMNRNATKFDHNIYLNSEVTQIDWDNEKNNIKVSCANGTTYFSDYVIITIPLGALKNQYKTLFSPSLPQRKEKTIELLGVGGVGKILFHFPKRWWGNYDIFFSWSQEDFNTVDFKQGPALNGKSWVTSLVGFYIHPDNPKVLSAIFCGALMREIELTNEEIILDGIYYVTQKFLGKVFENITRPDKMKCFNWYNNPYFGVATSVQTLESEKEGLNGDTLAEPVLSGDGKVRLLFAGEAANGFSYGSVNSAVNAGFREANRIIANVGMGENTEKLIKLPRILIVGAGASGITTASWLIQNGIDNVKILEAEDRIGGRIYSTHFGDDIIDLGAQFCIENGIVYNLINNPDLFVNNTVGSEVYHSKKGKLPETFTKTLFERIYELHHQKTQEGVSWKQNILEQYNKTLVDHFSSDSDKSLIRDSINLVEKTFTLKSGAFSLDKVSGEGSGEYPPNFKLLWKTGGYKTFIDFLVKTYLERKTYPRTDNIISLKSEINKIEWDDKKNEVKVSCIDGSSYIADHVVITTSLGVLKKQYSTLFSPPLPIKKQETIQALGFGSLGKIAYYFPEKWWGDSNLVLAWSEDDLHSVSFKKGPHKNGLSWVTNFTGFFVVRNNPNVLLAWYIGDLIPEVELCSDDVLIDGAYYVLKKFVGQTYKNVSKPTKVMVSNWFNNAHFSGVISYETLESLEKKVTGEDLSEPVIINGKPRFLFAGEATNNVRYGSVNGAVHSGFREADRIINLYKPTK